MNSLNFDFLIIGLATATICVCLLKLIIDFWRCEE